MWSLAPRGLYRKSYQDLREWGALASRQVPSRRSRRLTGPFVVDKAQVWLSANPYTFGAVVVTHFANFTVNRQALFHSGLLQVLILQLLLLLFLTFGVLVVNPQKLFYTVANSARGLLNRGKDKK